MSDKMFQGLLAAIAIAVVGAIFIFGGDSSSGGKWIGDPLEVATGEILPGQTEAQPADHVLGPEDAPVTIIEYADFECPACYSFYPVLKQLEETYAKDLRVVFRHNPLSSLHPNAFAAHRAAVAASLQDKFWEMHDLLYEQQPTWSQQQAGLDTSQAAQKFEGFAEQLALDMDKFRTDVESSAVFDYIDSHLDSGNQLDVTGTPTLFINGELIEARTLEELSSIIDGIIADSKQQQTDTGSNQGQNQAKPTEN